MPHRNWKIDGRHLADSFDVQRATHTVNTQEKNHTMRTPPIVAFWATVAPMIMGREMMTATGRMYRKYRVTSEKFNILL